MGFGSQGLPIGLSVLGDRLSEGLLLRVGIDFQSDTDWHQRRPPVDTLPIQS
jgi:Asp-tRNA(Asn)/Glu-tRNA(Gln) amidotransferase A subunit family amidase